ncbi:MAG: hypothetical protein WKF81_06965 [Thermomicrobiales bacterium]
MFEVQTRDIAAQQYLTETRYGRVEGLPDWTDPAIGRGWERAEQYGGVVGPVLLVFHGAITAEEAGTVEVCVPVALEQQIPLTEPHRYESAHTEAFTRLRKSQTDFPEILGAYDAVAKWMMSNGKSFGKAPREAYFTDFMAAGDDDDVADVAFPIGE